jgi:hypothetical protein
MKRHHMKRILAVALLAAGCTATPATTTSSTVPPPLVSLELSPEGLGDLPFGLDPDSVITDVTALYGAPDVDTDWIVAEPNLYGSCPGELMRAIGWGSLVTIFIDDGDSDLGGYFYTYTYGYEYETNTGGVDPRALNLTTESGVGVGTTVGDLRTAFDTDLIIEGDVDLDSWTFRSDSDGFRGLLSGQTETDTVTLIEPLEGC